MPQVLVAPTAFKGTLTPVEVAQAMALGLKSAGKEFAFTLCPLADGGDGTVESLHFACGGKLSSLCVPGPLSAPARASWLKLDRLAVVELASACGMACLKSGTLDALNAHTSGLGEVLKSLLEQGEKEIVIALGGSASTDGGTGALRALGARFLSRQNRELPLGGGALVNLAQVDLRALNKWQANLQIAVDVTNPLLGKDGAARVFAPQKGASPGDVEILEEGLKVLAELLEQECGRKKRDLPGSGAAGGTAFGLATAFDARLISGFDFISQAVSLEEKIRNSDLVISGEGFLDGQSLAGKATGKLALLCQKWAKPLCLVCGKVEAKINWRQKGILPVAVLDPQAKIAAGTHDIAHKVKEIMLREIPQFLTGQI